MSQALHDCELSLGAQNPYTLTIRHELATRQGKTEAEAEAGQASMRDALEKMDQALNLEDLHHLSSIRDLAAPCSAKAATASPCNFTAAFPSAINAVFSIPPPGLGTRIFFAELFEVLDRFRQEDRYDMLAVERDLKGIGLSLPKLGME